jgi:hypothetical protein
MLSSFEKSYQKKTTKLLLNNNKNLFKGKKKLKIKTKNIKKRKKNGK